MPDDQPIAVLVAALLADQKQFAGDPEPRRPNREGEQGRIHWPVLVRGQSAQCYVAATMFPEDEDLRFTISLVLRQDNIWRLDFEPDDRIEMNPELAGHEFSLATIRGPHCHRWEENRLFASRDRIPSPLPFRVPLPSSIRTWEQAFRHFVTETNIDQPAQIPQWPRRRRLL